MGTIEFFVRWIGILVLYSFFFLSWIQGIVHNTYSFQIFTHHSSVRWSGKRPVQNYCQNLWIWVFLVLIQPLTTLHWFFTTIYLIVLANWCICPEQRHFFQFTVIPWMFSLYINLWNQHSEKQRHICSINKQTNSFTLACCINGLLCSLYHHNFKPTVCL